MTAYAANAAQDCRCCLGAASDDQASPVGGAAPVFQTQPLTRAGGLETAGMARPEGLEPPAYRFEACCSVQLSYERRLAEEGRGGPMMDTCTRMDVIALT